MKEHLIDWSMSGTFKTMAATADDAQIAFDAMSKSDLAREGDLEQQSAPQTQDEIDAAEAAWKASWRRNPRNPESING